MRVFAALIVFACLVSVLATAQIVNLYPLPLGEPLVRGPSCSITPPAGEDRAKLAEQCVKETRELREQAMRDVAKSLKDIRPYTPPGAEERINDLEGRIRDLETRR